MARTPKIRIGDLSAPALPIQQDSIIVLSASAGGWTDTYRTAQPTVITNGGTQRDRGIELDRRRPRRPAPSLKSKR
jgi:hypothetical protein